MSISVNYRRRNSGLINPTYQWLRILKLCFSFMLLVILLNALFSPGSRSKSCSYIGQNCACHKKKRHVVTVIALTWKWHHDFHHILWTKASHMSRPDINGTGSKILPLVDQKVFGNKNKMYHNDV